VGVARVDVELMAAVVLELGAWVVDGDALLLSSDPLPETQNTFHSNPTFTHSKKRHGNYKHVIYIFHLLDRDHWN